MKAFSGLLVQRFQEHGFDIDRPQWVIMAKGYHLDGDALLQSDVVELFMGNKTGVTRAVENLVKRGWIEQQIDKNDRRNRILSLTDEGRAAVPGLMSIVRSSLNEVTHGIDPTEMETCKKVLAQLIENIKGDSCLKEKKS